MNLQNQIKNFCLKFRIDLENIDKDNLVLFSINSTDLLNSLYSRVNSLILLETNGDISLSEYLKMIEPCSLEQHYLEKYFENLH